MKPLIRAVLCVYFIFIVIAVPAFGNPPVLHRYSTGKRVAALQWLLSGKKPSVFKIQAYKSPINGYFDLKTVRAVKNMKYRLGYPLNRVNSSAGPYFFDVLKGTTTRPFSYRHAAGLRLLRQQRVEQLVTPTTPSGRIALLVSEANYLIAHAGEVGYTQTSSRMQIVRDRIKLPPLPSPATSNGAHRKITYIYEDCSSSVTGLYWLAAGGSSTNPHPIGLPDPNGYKNPPFRGYGYTGTQASSGRVVWRIGQPISQLKIGDLIFYGGGFPHHHVTMYLGNGRVFSHGTNTGPFNLPIFYRNDAVGAHRYVFTE